MNHPRASDMSAIGMRHGSDVDTMGGGDAEAAAEGALAGGDDVRAPLAPSRPDEATSAACGWTAPQATNAKQHTASRAVTSAPNLPPSSAAGQENLGPFVVGKGASQGSARPHACARPLASGPAARLARVGSVSTPSRDHDPGGRH